ncbi:ornithine cyclodeaminase family protein [Parashewanella curva]|uniref:Ornithine cyclodeaminase family protein n=1 Tax=Parashewanella curva TaxID=2338552 RepID=A0A3L8PXZ9_9GAMM|nr:ornithine cyclodeaminase family protein [Parashewanella curva]RLV60204.1 ornithine cyclodeaminase family protein [Parashewanella curva]
MKLINSSQVKQALTFPELVGALRQTFSSSFGMPQRQVFELSDKNHDAFAVLPAWNEEVMGVKSFTYLPDNPAHLKSIYAQILLFSRTTGEPLAVVDGTEATYWRTAAVSALAATFLAPAKAERLLLCGTGNLASYMALAHASVRPIKEVKVWGRNASKIQIVVEQIKAERPDLHVSSETELTQQTVSWADIVSCATRSPKPLFDGGWVSEGTHVDLVGNHLKNARECDTELMLRSEVYVDAKINTFAEAGELLIPLAEKKFNLAQVKGELSQLCKTEIDGRASDSNITLFKSVGTAIADLSCAHLVYQKN